jgi:hypothetical protein
MHLCFALHEGQAENHLYVFPYDLNTHLTFIVSFSCSFVYVHLHVYNMVAKFLLSRLYISCPCFKFLWSQLTNAYLYDQSLGMLIRLKSIYNFWCSMLVFTPFSYCFVTLRGIFMWFLELTYWQDTTVPVPYFLLFLCFRKATQEIFSELDEISSRSFFSRKLPEDRKRAGGGPEAALTHRWRGPGPGRATLVWGAPGCPLTMPLRLYKVSG